MLGEGADRCRYGESEGKASEHGKLYLIRLPGLDADMTGIRKDVEVRDCH